MIRVPQNTAALIELGAGFHPDLTGRENYFLNSSILGISIKEAKKRFDEIITFAGLERFIDTPVKRYSSGMYVRLAFSIAAHVDPDLLLVDEVLVVGDARFQRKCIERMKELRKNGATILFVSHNMNLVQSVCDEGLFLKKGRILSRGPIIDVIRDYEKFIRNKEADSIAPLNVTHVGTDLKETGITINSVSIRSPQQGHFTHDSLLAVDVAIDTKTEQKSNNLLVRVIRSDGTTCSEYRSRNLKQSLPDFSRKIDLEILFNPIQLASGAYIVEVRIQDPSDAVTLALGQSEWFQVQGPSTILNYEYSGVFVPNLKWEAKKN
jgi:ABC-type multidrug transport system ATPase subunit